MLHAIPALVLPFGAGEVFARYWCGLGTSLLNATHPNVEYMFPPDQDVMRFGNRQLGMSSQALKDVTQPRLVLAMGDSDLNGGNLTDQDDLTSTLASGSSVFYGNVSVGSWGPTNIASWIKAFDSINADTVILVLSSHDLRNTLAFSTLNPEIHPVGWPVFALAQGFVRYLPHFLHSLNRKPAESGDDLQSHIDNGRAAMETLLNLRSTCELKMCLVRHQTRSDLANAPDPKYGEVVSRFEARAISVVDFSA